MFLSVAKIILGILTAYLIGSLPTAYLLAKLYKRIDIRQHGSGNVGATNTFRVLGKLPGIIVLAVDIVKGLICPTLVADLFGQTSLLNRIVLAVAVVVGHNWTIFLKFKGGKGMATSLGVLIGLAIKISVLRLILLLSVGVWVISFLISGYVSLSSLIAAMGLPVLMVIFAAPFELIAMGIIFCGFVVLRHRSNISRLVRGEESRVNFAFLKRKRFP